MKHSDITETNQPFRFFLKPGEIQLINDSAQSISTPAKKDGVYLIIIQHGLQFIPSLFISATEIIFRRTAQSFPDHNLKAPFLQGMDTGLCFFGGHITSGAGYTDRLALFKIRWDPRHHKNLYLLPCVQ